MWFFSSTLTSAVLTNATVAMNDAGNGAYGGGGIFVGGSHVVETHNSIVAENTASDGATNDDIFGTVASSSSYNLIGPGGAGGLMDGSNGNIVLDPNESADLDTLDDNGGPTLTHALLASSPAIDKGDNAQVVALELEYDQRGPGFDRVIDGGLGSIVDIGAFEYEPSGAFGTAAVVSTMVESQPHTPRGNETAFPPVLHSLKRREVFTDFGGRNTGSSRIEEKASPIFESRSLLLALEEGIGHGSFLTNFDNEFPTPDSEDAIEAVAVDEYFGKLGTYLRNRLSLDFNS